MDISKYAAILPLPFLNNMFRIFGLFDVAFW